MSLSSITMAARDPDLESRTTASVQKEARANPQFGDTYFGRQVMTGVAVPWAWYSYVIAVATETAYEYAINAGNPRPGYDPSVVTDADIATAVQVNWPPDPVDPTPPI